MTENTIRGCLIGEDIDKDSWIYGYEIITHPNPELCYEKEMQEDISELKTDKGRFSVYKDSISYFSGFVDFYNTDIFEQDIIHSKGKDEYGLIKLKDDIFIVEWTNGGPDKLLSKLAPNLQVIGNNFEVKGFENGATYEG